MIDAHVHFWDPDARDYPWLEAYPELQRPFVPEDFDPGRHRVEAMVFVEADCGVEQALDEVKWVAGLAEHHPLVRGMVAYAPLHRGEQAREALGRVAREPLVVGVRRVLQSEPPALFSDPALADGIGLLADHDLPFDVCVTHEQLSAVASLIAACPDVSFVLDHLGKPPVAAGQLEPWRTDLARVAALPNVVCKLSGLTTEATPAWRPGDIRPYLDHALAVFGPNRCMVGSDWPVATLATSIEAWFDLVDDVLEPLAADERRAVLSGCARGVYALDVQSRPHAAGLG
jgi:L-fuconolactonase